MIRSSPSGSGAPPGRPRGRAQLVTFELIDQGRRGFRRPGPGGRSRSRGTVCGPARLRSRTSVPSPGIAPRLSAGTRPARDDGGLPRSDGPTTARNRARGSSSARRRMSRLVTGLSSEESRRRPASRNARSPLYGFRIGPSRSRAVRGPSSERAAPSPPRGPRRSAGSRPWRVARATTSSTPRRKLGADVADRRERGRGCGDRSVHERVSGNGCSPVSISNTTIPRA
jgi:hypothetical protein